VDTHTYEPLFGRIGRSNDVKPFSFTGTLEQAERAWREYVRTFLADIDAELKIEGHPDSTKARSVVVVVPDGLAPRIDDHENVVSFLTHLNDPTCNGKYPDTSRA